MNLFLHQFFLLQLVKVNVIILDVQIFCRFLVAIEFLSAIKQRDFAQKDAWKIGFRREVSKNSNVTHREDESLMANTEQHVLQPYLQRYSGCGGRVCFYCVKEIVEGFELCYGAYSKRFCCKHCVYDWFDELNKEHQQFVLDNIQALGENMDEHESDYQLIGLDKSGKENWSDPTGSGHGLRYQRPASATHPYTSAADEASGESVPFELRHQIDKKSKEDKL